MRSSADSSADRRLPRGAAFVALLSGLLLACGGSGESTALAPGDFDIPPPPECTASGRICRDNAVIECVGGFYVEQEACGAEALCVAGACELCPEGKVVCGGSERNELWRCPLGGAGTPEQTGSCGEDEICKLGFCINPCSPDLKDVSNIGCEYYAVDLENAAVGPEAGATAEHAQFAVILSNPDDTYTLTVEVRERPGGDALPALTRSVLPGELAIIGMPARNIRGTQRGHLGFYLKGSIPFVAYQFNPLDNARRVYSNDASLLLPASAAGTEYLAITGQQRGFVVVVALGDGTAVEVVPTRPTRAGPEGSGLPALGKGEVLKVTLAAGEVLAVRADSDGDATTDDGDLTGTSVSASQPVMAFSGSEFATTSWACCADHLEQQLVPVDRWGTEVVAARSAPRGIAPDHWRVVASEADTVVTFEPARVHEPVTLGRGEVLDLVADEHFVLRGSAPVSVAQLLASSSEVMSQGDYCTPEGATTCPLDQVCAGVGSLGTCRGSCAVDAGACEAPGEVCQPWFGAASAGSGRVDACQPGRCEAPGGCPAGAVCVPDLFSDGTDGCLESCSDDGDCTYDRAQCVSVTGSNEKVCLARGCFSSWECGSNGSCEGGRCVAMCEQAALCADEYGCYEVGFERALCVAPSCRDRSDCPPGHACDASVDGRLGACEPIGDPALIIVVPVQQYRADYVFLVPNAYVEDYVTIAAPAGTEVSLDGVLLPASDFVSVAGGFGVARLPLSDGVHRLQASAPVGVTVFGYDDDVSYGYPAGTRLSELGGR